jgi:hypothetical protein
MRLLDAYRAIRCVAILQHEEVSKEWLWTIKICLFPKSCPEVKSTTNCLFCPIVEIVAKRGTYLGFGFDSSDQCLLADNEEIPFFGWSKETGEYDCLLSENTVPRNTRLYNKFSEKINETVQLHTTGDGTT